MEQYISALSVLRVLELAINSDEHSEQAVYCRSLERCHKKPLTILMKTIAMQTLQILGVIDFYGMRQYQKGYFVLSFPNHQLLIKNLV